MGWYLRNSAVSRRGRTSSSSRTMQPVSRNSRICFRAASMETYSVILLLLYYIILWYKWWAQFLKSYKWWAQFLKSYKWWAFNTIRNIHCFKGTVSRFYRIISALVLRKYLKFGSTFFTPRCQWRCGVQHLGNHSTVPQHTLHLKNRIFSLKATI